MPQSHWSQLLPVFDRCCVFLTSDPTILGVLECLGVVFPLGAVEFVPKVCSGHSPRQSSTIYIPILLKCVQKLTQHKFFL